MSNVSRARYHRGALVLAFAMALVFMVPLAAPGIRLGAEYKGIAPEVSADDYFYSARIQDVLNGHPFIGNPYLWEHENSPPQQVFLAEYLLAQPLRLLHMRAVDGRAPYAFILSIICFLLAYAVLYRVGQSRFWALSIAAFLFFYLQPFKFLRPVSPQFNFIFWLTLFLLLWKVIQGDKKNRTIILGALNFGFLFYIYPYYWAYYTIFFGLLCFTYFFFERHLILPIIKIAGGGFLIGAWYFYYTYQASQLPWYEESLTRLGMVYTHFPSGILTFAACVPVLLLYAIALKIKSMKWNVESIFMVASMAAVLIAVNVHVITGKNIHFAAHYYPIAYFIAGIACSYFLCVWEGSQFFEREKYLRVWKLMKVFTVCVVIFLSIVTTASYLRRFWTAGGSANTAYIQTYEPVFHWLNTHASPEAVVFANADFSRLIPLYTSQNVFFARYSHYFLISDEEVLARFAAQNYFEDLHDEWLKKYTRDFYGARYVSSYFHAQQGNIVRQLFSQDSVDVDFLPPDALAHVHSIIDETHRDTFEHAVKKYHIDYVLWDSTANPNWRIREQKFLTPVFESGNFKIYKVQ